MLGQIALLQVVSISQRIGVFLNRGRHDLFRRLKQSGVNHLETGVTERTSDDLRSTIVAIEPGFRHDDAVRALHEA